MIWWRFVAAVLGLLAAGGALGMAAGYALGEEAGPAIGFLLGLLVGGVGMVVLFPWYDPDTFGGRRSR